MDTAGSEPQRIGNRNPEERRVAPLELFFDLVFVFAITQVTAFLSDVDKTTGARVKVAIYVTVSSEGVRTERAGVDNRLQGR